MVVHQTHNSMGNYSYNAFFYENCEWFYHFHKNPELVYVLEGAVELIRNGKVFLLTQGQFAMVLPNELHGYRTPHSSRVWVGVFSGDFVGEFVSVTKDRQAVDPRFTCTGAQLQYLLDGLITEEPAQLLDMKSLLYAACAAFWNQVQLVDGAQEGDLVWQVSHYVAEHFREDLTFERLAAELGYEYHYLSRRFHRAFGMNFRQFLNMHRIDHARQLLLQSDADVVDVAFGVGFQTLRTFNRVFLQHSGMTPSQFRRTAPRLRLQRQNSDGSFYYTE